jgi:hypothetical protein
MRRCGGCSSRPRIRLPAMETKWLEDFVSLAETRSFSRSAQLRHVTQPAFSRRIQSLEAWAGTDLVDRSSYPTRLTPAGETCTTSRSRCCRPAKRRAMLRGHTSASGQDVIEFAVPHTLAFTFFPAWVSDLREAVRPDQEPPDRAERARCRAAAGRRQLRPADRLPPQLAAVPARARPLRDGQPGRGGAGALCQARCRGAADVPAARGGPARLPYLGLCAGAYLGQMVDMILKQSGVPIHFDRSTRPTWPRASRPWRSRATAWPSCPTARSRRSCKARGWSAPLPPEMSMQITMEVRMPTARSRRTRRAARRTPCQGGGTRQAAGVPGRQDQCPGCGTSCCTDRRRWIRPDLRP